MNAAASGDLAGVVFAAGLGTRLRPLTLRRPKALCPVDGSTLLDLALERLAPHVAACAVNASWLAEQIARHVAGRAYVSYEEQPLGSAGALGALRGWVAGRAVLLTNADSYLPDGLAALLDGWDGERPRVLVQDADGGGPLGGDDYVGAALLPWADVRDLPARFGGLLEAVWQPALAAGRLDRVPYRGFAVDCGTPADYLRANLHASGGASVVGRGALVEGGIERCVLWDGSYVGPAEHLVECIRAGTRDEPVTVDAS